MPERQNLIRTLANDCNGHYYYVYQLLCLSADEVRNSLQAVTSDIQEYCESCMWKLADSRNLDELHFCSEEVPQCGAGIYVNMA